jgi:hypothetical protein
MPLFTLVTLMKVPAPGKQLYKTFTACLSNKQLIILNSLWFFSFYLCFTAKSKNPGRIHSRVTIRRPITVAARYVLGDRPYLSHKFLCRRQKTQ